MKKKGIPPEEQVQQYAVSLPRLQLVFHPPHATAQQQRVAKLLSPSDSMNLIIVQNVVVITILLLVLQKITMGLQYTRVVRIHRKIKYPKLAIMIRIMGMVEMKVTYVFKSKIEDATICMAFTPTAQQLT